LISNPCTAILRA